MSIALGSRKHLGFLNPILFPLVEPHSSKYTLVVLNLVSPSPHQQQEIL